MICCTIVLDEKGDGNLPYLYLNIDIGTGSGIIGSMLDMEFSFSSAVSVPFPVGTNTVVCDGSLGDCLGKLFPDKKAYFEKQDPGRMIISALPQAPFGVSPDVLAAFFFDDLEGTLRWAIERFGLTGIKLAGLSEFKEMNIRDVVFRRGIPRREAGVRLNLFEFNRLISAAREGKVSSGLLLSIFRDPGNVHSFFVPDGTSLEKIIESERGLTAGELYDPFSGKSFGTGDTISGAMEHALVSSDSEYIASPGMGQLFAFPWFDRTIAMRKAGRSENSEQPCSNCLACGDHCPADLSPSILYHQIIKGGMHDTPGLGLFTCIRCGLCSFVCPSSLPLFDEITGAIDRLIEESDE